MPNNPTNKKDCIESGGQWKDPPGECVDAYDLMDTSLINADANDKKKECENQDGVWKDPPGECKKPNK